MSGALTRKWGTLQFAATRTCKADAAVVLLSQPECVPTCANADARQTAAPEPANDAGSSERAGQAAGVGAPAPARGGCAARALAADAAVLKLCAFGPSIRAHHSQPWRQDGGSLCYNRARPACLQSRGRSREGQ